MKILFFGLGAVGAVMATTLQQLYARQEEPLALAFAVRDEARARAALFRSKVLLEEATFIPFDDEAAINAFAPQVVVNAAIPELNNTIATRALGLGAHYVDMASDIYNEQTFSEMRFSQQGFHQAFVDRGLMGLINLGFSPGLTNFIIGEKIAHLTALPGAARIRSVRLFLLEELISSRVLFSWAPKVALDELMAKPAYIRDGELLRLSPFSSNRPFHFDPAHATETYPVFQEEVLSLHQSYPQVDEIRLYCGGNEVELFKNLFQLNLLSRDLKVGSAPVEQVVRKVLPKMKSPKVIEYYNKRHIIKSARFEVVAEIETVSPGRHPVVESVGIRFSRYRELLGTPYSGATYIAYPTGIAAAVILHYTLLAHRQGRVLEGIIAPETLPERLGAEMTERIKHDLAELGVEFTTRLSGLAKERRGSVL